MWHIIHIRDTAIWKLNTLDVAYNPYRRSCFIQTHDVAYNPHKGPFSLKTLDEAYVYPILKALTLYNINYIKNYNLTLNVISNSNIWYKCVTYRYIIHMKGPAIFTHCIWISNVCEGPCPIQAVSINTTMGKLNYK